MNCLVVKKIRKKVKGYLKNITDNELEEINEKAILNKGKLTYIKNNVRHTLLFRDDEIILIRESNELKNLLTFSKNRSILSEYIIKENNLCIDILVKTLEIEQNDNELYIKYEIVDSNSIYEYKIIMED